jgi:pimeloyl-ACP methyl ester carboxylesterase
MRRLLLGSAPDTDGALRSVLTSLPMTLVRARLQAIAGVDVRPELSRQRCPVLAMQAQHDRLVPASAGAEMQAILPSLRLVTLPGPHGLLQACPREAAGVVEEFLETALAARPHST